MSESQLAVALWAVHVAFWLQIGRRAFVARWRLAEERGQQADGPAPASDPAARLAMWLVTVSMTAYYVLLIAWGVEPRWAGPLLLSPSLLLQVTGLAAAAFGVALMAWAFHVFRSFRFEATLESAHRLCTNGPYRWLRHPLYVGINLVYWGSFLALPGLGFLIQAFANSLTYDFRARVEERVLVGVFGQEYQTYMKRAARFVPGVY